MNDREKLIDILVNLDTYGCEECQKCASFKYDLPCNDKCFCEKTADHLLANGVTIQRWIPVTERLPRNGEHILVYYSDGWICDQYSPVDGGVTHWMPLPEPPKEVE